MVFNDVLKFIPMPYLIWRVSASKVDEGNLFFVDPHPLVLVQSGVVGHLGEGLAEHGHVAVLAPDFKLVKLLVADVVGHVLDNEQNRSSAKKGLR
jgi:hypothetical protein